ncbi:UNVERIFIED_CONTAM: hypothetical protein FKN15_064772 [Acipenser sinensis]
MSGQTLTDRIAAAQYSVTGSAVARAVCKATTHEVMGPKKKHLEYLIQATNETNVNIPQMADTLFERATNSSWVVVFKALVTTHHLMVQGNEQVGIDKGDIPDLTYDHPVSDTIGTAPFFSFLSASNNLLDLQPDFSSAQPAGAAAAPAASSAWGDSLMVAPVPAHASASESLLSDPYVVEASPTPTPTPTEIPPAPAPATATTPIAAAAAAPPVPTTAASTSGDMDLFGDAFAASPGEGPAASEGGAAPATPIPAAAAALDACAGTDPFAPSEGRAAVPPEMDLFAMKPVETSIPVATPTTSAALQTASAAALTFITDTTTTVTTTAPPSLDIFGDLFDSMPEPNASTAPKQDVTPSIDLFATVDAFSAPSAAPAAASPAKPDTAGVLDLFGGLGGAFMVPSPATASPAPAQNNLMQPSFDAAFGTTPTATSSGFDSSDAFGGSSAEPQPATAASSADLLSGLGGAFMVPSPATASPAPAQNNLMQPSFDAAFGTTPTATSSGFDSSVFDGLEDLLMPTMTPQGQGAGAGLGGIAGVQSGKALAGDLNSSLANLAGNLGIAGTQKKDLQWNAGERKLTGGVNWQPKVAPATWGTPGSQMTGAVPPGGVPPVGGVTPVAAAPPVGAIPPMGAVQPQPGFGMPPAAGAGAPMMPQSSMMYPQPMMRPPFGASASPGAPLSPSPTPATQSPKKPPTKDPLADLNIKDFL